MLKICVIGLGYVGLPICLKLAKNFNTVGFDINTKRINSLKNQIDLNHEFKKKDLKKKNLIFSKEIKDLNNCNFYIICVPTPITNSKLPDLRYIEASFKLLSKILKKGDIIIKINNVAIKDIYGYMDVLQKLKPGESSVVVVLRNDKKITLNVKH